MRPFFYETIPLNFCQNVIARRPSLAYDGAIFIGVCHDLSAHHRSHTHHFTDLKDVMGKATPARSGDCLAGVAAQTYAERMAARMCLAAVPLKRFLEELLIPYEADEVNRLIIDSHDALAFGEISHLTVADFRDWLLADTTDSK